ncbi:uncharacterized protein LOC142985000 [Anticarsia gemmatalis]|uniref:uncharacterized protein LOC142985000 n=1 Tax=Anticarsia gemmatalis TaxID=129554 RepID=UPI003F777A15
MASASGNPTYPNCAHIKREEPNMVITEEFLTKIQEADVLPLFENEIFTESRRRHYSLQNNELLICRWKEYSNMKGRVKTPFQFPSFDDFHFKNYQIGHYPSESGRNKQNCRMTMHPGPGYDKYGEIPIPDHNHVRRKSKTGGKKAQELKK